MEDHKKYKYTLKYIAARTSGLIKKEQVYKVYWKEDYSRLIPNLDTKYFYIINNQTGTVIKESGMLRVVVAEITLGITCLGSL